MILKKYCAIEIKILKEAGQPLTSECSHNRMKRFFRLLKEEYTDCKILLRTVPSLTVSIFILSVVCANLMANKELVHFKYIALDCGFVFSWIMFLCMDVICKRWGARASVKISVIALAVNLAVCAVFAALSFAPGKWGAFYESGSKAANDALNATFGGTWYVVFGSALAFLISSVINAALNAAVGAHLHQKGFLPFAVRSYISTAVAQLADNLIFATVVSKLFFGWTWTQVFACSATGALFELLCEALFSGLGYKIVCGWEKENVGKEYFAYRQKKAV